MCKCIYISICIYTHIHITMTMVCKYIIYVCLHVYMYVHIYTYICISIYIYIYIHIYIHIHIFIYTYIYIHTYYTKRSGRSATRWPSIGGGWDIWCFRPPIASKFGSSFPEWQSPNRYDWTPWSSSDTTCSRPSLLLRFHPLKAEFLLKIFNCLMILGIPNFRVFFSLVLKTRLNHLEPRSLRPWLPRTIAYLGPHWLFLLLSWVYNDVHAKD